MVFVFVFGFFPFFPPPPPAPSPNEPPLPFSCEPPAFSETETDTCRRRRRRRVGVRRTGSSRKTIARRFPRVSRDRPTSPNDRLKISRIQNVSSSSATIVTCTRRVFSSNVPTVYTTAARPYSVRNGPIRAKKDRQTVTASGFRAAGPWATTVGARPHRGPDRTEIRRKRTCRQSGVVIEHGKRPENLSYAKRTFIRAR